MPNAPATIRTGNPVFPIDIDIDRFKHINDSIGYSQGDELIRAFGQRLQASLPANYTFVSGDGGAVVGRGLTSVIVLSPNTSRSPR